MARAKRVKPKAEIPSHEWKDKILDAALPHIAFDGWHDSTLKAAAEEAGLTDAQFHAAFPRGVADALLHFSERADQAAAEKIEAADLKSMRVRERVTFAVRTRMEEVAPHKEAARKAAAVFALPHNALDGATCVYRATDMMWRSIGDTSTDFNFYTKRALLAGVYSSTMLYWFADNSQDSKDTWKFLDDRIANVMQIEKVKAQVTKFAEGLPNPLTILGALRYPKR